MQLFRQLLFVCLLFTLLPLSACTTGPLLADVRLSQAVLRPRGNGEFVTLSYSINQRARVWIELSNAAGTRFRPLRDGETRTPSTTPYTLKFDGTVPTDDPELIRQVLPQGEYTLTVRAVADNGETVEQQTTLQIEVPMVTPPLFDNLLVFPEVISPNADGIDDVAEITYSLPVTASVNMTITGPDGTIYPFVTNDQEEPQLQRQVWNGRTIDSNILSDGVYTYTIQAADRYGNIAQRRGQITIRDSGQPEATILESRIVPQAIMLGELITVTLRVRNTGTVPIRTYGPPSGYTYSTKEVFSSVEQGQYDAKSGGFWRVGMDWDANSGGGPKRYPFRWAISPRPPEQWKIPFQEDVLLPGEEAVVIGRIRVEQQETKMGFYVGLIQDGVGFRQDRLGRTIILVGF
jgi:hypothetical protein